MSLLIWIALTAAVVLGMCIGALINRGYGRAWQRQAQRSQVLVQQLYTQLDAAEQRTAMAADAERVAAPPVVVNLHLPAAPDWPPPPSWPPVVEGQVVPELPGRDA